MAGARACGGRRAKRPSDGVTPGRICGLPPCAGWRRAGWCEPTAWKPTDRRPGDDCLPPPFAPNVDQQQAIDAVGAVIDATRFQTFLLHGVTGSGKTEVYPGGRRTRAPRGTRRAHSRAGDRSHAPARRARLRAVRRGSRRAAQRPLRGERLDEWRRLASGEARIVVGARSAVFAPLRRLGLVVVDEEHEAPTSRKKGYATTPAISRSFERAIVVVRPCSVSATPSIESHHNALSGRYRLLELDERVEQTAAADGRRGRSEGRAPAGRHRRCSSPRLRGRITPTFRPGEQSLVFLNRRGYATYLQCTPAATSTARTAA